MSKEFFNAVNQNNLDTVSNFVLTQKLPIDTKDEDGRTALMYAASGSYVEMVDWLLRHGANPEQSDNEGYTVLWGICESNANSQTRLSVVTAIARKNHYISLDKNFDLPALIATLEQRLLIEISGVDKNYSYPFYTSTYVYIRELIKNLQSHYFEDKLLNAIQNNNAVKVIEALICGADIERLYYCYRRMLHDLVSGDCNSAEFNKELSQDRYAFLGHLQRIIAIIAADLQKNHSNKYVINQQKILRDVLKKAKTVLSRYDYRKNDAYKANSAILFLTMLAMTSKQHEQPNSPTGTIIVRNVQTQDTLTLKDISQKVIETVQSTATIDKRSIAFVAIGITRQGRILITTNYHAPRVYDLESLFDANKYNDVNGAYKNLKVSFSLGKIHAETMLAAISTQLDIEQIFIVDANGNKKQNCVYCANYLFHKGYSNEPHFERINNYNLPTQFEINSAVSFLQQRVPAVNQFQFCGPAHMQEQQPPQLVHRQIFTMLSADEQAAILAGQSLLQTIINFTLRYFPKVLFGNDKENIGSMYGETAKLVNNASSFFYRDKLVSGVMNQIKKPNARLALKCDGHVVLADNNSLKAKEPDSPRSARLATITNKWLNAGQGTQRVTVDNDSQEIRLSRVPRAV